MGLWGRVVTDGGIQIANYNIRDKQQGAWHHDASADISVVVPLNTGEYEGGGTEFQGRGVVEPLPTGSALMFPSFTHMHRGLPVQSGDRYLLVFWLISRPCWEDKKLFRNEFYLTISLKTVELKDKMDRINRTGTGIASLGRDEDQFLWLTLLWASVSYHLLYQPQLKHVLTKK